MEGKRRVSVLVLVFLVLVAPFLGLKSAQGSNTKTNASILPAMSLTVVGANGIQVVLNQTGIAKLPSYSGYGGFKNVLGNIKDWGKYTGVSLAVLCSLVGGINANDSLQVKASDNYTITLAYAQVNGDFVTYDNVTGQPVAHNQPLTPILAYMLNGANLASDVGPLRLAIVGPEGLCTNSTLWVKWVVSMGVMEKDVPEFPSLMVFPLLLLITLMAALSLKAQRQNRTRSRDSESAYGN